MGNDLINYIDGLLGRKLHGSMARLSFARNSGFSGVQVEMILRKYGIRVWDRNIHQPEEISFHVKTSQAEWAEYVLLRAGVPLTNQPINRNNYHTALTYGYDNMPKPWTEQGIRSQTFVDHVVEFINKITA